VPDVQRQPGKKCSPKVRLVANLGSLRFLSAYPMPRCNGAAGLEAVDQRRADRPAGDEPGVGLTERLPWGCTKNEQLHMRKN